MTDENEERLEQPEQLFGDWLRAEMERQNISIQELANKTDLIRAYGTSSGAILGILKRLLD